jgi:hypothetical protein
MFWLARLIGEDQRDFRTDGISAGLSYRIADLGFLRRDQGFKLLILLVGERGFEPPTPLSRTRFSDLLKRAEIG